ncbi:glycosyltransferase [Thalassorhabdus alkalitolerans]|uniref:Glycosyltransferase n=1 Tax=Thalassorhabdus alkalitolerans TaxID=2282697 RepID=A0ABW0YM70_9BACI
MNPQVTVLMSVYNEKSHLDESIKSILNQSFSDFEFLIIDDCSNDGSNKIIEEYAKKDKRIKLVRNNTNRGLSYNLAEGVDLASAPWIARMDADDIAFQNRLSTQINFIKQNPDIDVVGSFVIDIDKSGNEIELRKVPTTHSKIAKLIWTCPFIHPTVLFRKDAIIRAGSYNRRLRRRQDYDLWFRCHAEKLKFHNLEKPLLYYRSTDDYYKKNNFKVQLQQVKMGFSGARMVNASPMAYLGITIAFSKGILPYRIRKPINRLLKNCDPRRV